MVQKPRSKTWRTCQFGRDFATVIALILGFSACSIGRVDTTDRLEENARLIEEVKAFGKTFGITPTEALSRTAEERPALSMLWLWMQRDGTLALRAPLDIRMAIGFFTVRENLRLEQVYQVKGYSVYYRQGDEFADARSVATVGFAKETLLRRVKVILHEDLHGGGNFDLPWEIEESVVTPLGSLAAVEFFRRKDDPENMQVAVASLEEEREYARELNALVKQAEKLFKTLAIEDAKQQILDLIPSYPIYDKHFQREIIGQHPPTVLEAKLSHDLAYYRYFDEIAALSRQVGDLKTLIDDLKKISAGTPDGGVRAYLQQLKTQYSRPAT